jgi:putative heme-binding domain-containing protein
MLSYRERSCFNVAVRSEGGQMARPRSIVWLALVFLSPVGVTLVAERAPLPAQAPRPPAGAANPAGNNPHLGNAESIRSGMALYRIRCGECHGLDASGYRGPDLVSLMATDVTDERLFQTMRNGVPGTEMPPSQAPDDDLLMTIAYLRKLGTAAPAERPTGNVENGERLFAAQCASCHRVAGRGGRLGPDLTRIGIARSRTALIREIRTPSDWIPPTYETVTIVTKDGQRIRGTKKNEDVFSIQIMDVRERIQGYSKSELQDVQYETASLMPAFGPGRLNDSDLNDLVGYLSTLRGADLIVR